MMRFALAISLLALPIVGCQPNPGPPTDVTMRTTTQPAPAARREPAGRHVELMVRDASDTSLAGSLVGKDCRVQFRRDALGMAGNSPVGPTDNWQGRASLGGRVVELTDQWLVIAGEGDKRYVIPHAAILLIEVP